VPKSHLHETVDELKKFNARRKLKVISLSCKYHKPLYRLT